MLLIRYTIKPSSINGMGLFSTQFIPKDTCIWKYMEGVDRKISFDEIEKFDYCVKEFLMKYGYSPKNTNYWIICGDCSMYINHSFTPNLHDDVDTGFTITTRDIAPNEELTIDYRQICQFAMEEWFVKNGM